MTDGKCPKGYLEVCKALGQPSQSKNELPWRAEPLVAWVAPASELQSLVLSAELMNIWIRIMHVLSQTSGSRPWFTPALPEKRVLETNWSVLELKWLRKNLWGVRNRSGGAQNVVSDSHLFYRALKNQPLFNVTEHPDCSAGTKKLCQTSSESIKTPIRLKTLLQQVEKCSA